MRLEYPTMSKHPLSTLQSKLLYLSSAFDIEDHQYHSDAAVGYPVLEIDEDGSLSVSIAREMSALFDSLSSSGATRTVGRMKILTRSSHGT